MNVVADQPVVANRPRYDISDADEHTGDTEDAVTKYLDRWIEMDGRKSLLFNDRCTLGLLAAMRSARASAVAKSSSGRTTASTAPSR